MTGKRLLWTDGRIDNLIDDRYKTGMIDGQIVDVMHVDSVRDALYWMRGEYESRENLLGLGADVNNEIMFARAKFPDWPEDIVHAVAIAAEEMGEVVKDANEMRWSQGPATVKQIRKEIIQTMAMLVRLLTETPCLQDKDDEAEVWPTDDNEKGLFPYLTPDEVKVMPKAPPLSDPDDKEDA